MNDAVWKVTAGAMAVVMAALAIMSATKGYCGGVLECGNSTVPMHCYYAYQATMGIGIVGALMGVIGIFAKSVEGRRICALSVIALAVLAIAVLFVLIGVCANDAMSCNTHRTAAAAICVIACILAVVGIVRADSEKLSRPKAKL